MNDTELKNKLKINEFNNFKIAIAPAELIYNDEIRQAKADYNSALPSYSRISNDVRLAAIRKFNSDIKIPLEKFESVKAAAWAEYEFALAILETTNQHAKL